MCQPKQPCVGGFLFEGENMSIKFLTNTDKGKANVVTITGTVSNVSAQSVTVLSVSDSDLRSQGIDDITKYTVIGVAQKKPVFDAWMTGHYVHNNRVYPAVALSGGLSVYVYNDLVNEASDVLYRITLLEM